MTSKEEEHIYEDLCYLKIPRSEVSLAQFSGSFPPRNDLRQNVMADYYLILE